MKETKGSPKHTNYFCSLLSSRKAVKPAALAPLPWVVPGYQLHDIIVSDCDIGSSILTDHLHCAHHGDHDITRFQYVFCFVLVILPLTGWETMLNLLSLLAGCSLLLRALQKIESTGQPWLGVSGSSAEVGAGCILGSLWLLLGGGAQCCRKVCGFISIHTFVPKRYIGCLVSCLSAYSPRC